MSDTSHQSACKNCGKTAMLHRAKDQACPLGSRHRALGYTSYYREQFFEERVEKIQAMQGDTK